MARVALISDIDPDLEWQECHQLLATSHLLHQSGHQLSLMLTEELRALELWPKKVETLCPCPHWGFKEAIRSLGFWAHKKFDIFHFFPGRRTAKKAHGWLWIVPLIKSLHRPMIVTSLLHSAKEKEPFYLKQLLNLSDLILVPSQPLAHTISSLPDLITQNIQPFNFILHEVGGEVPSHYDELQSFIYMPGRWEEWESPVDSLLEAFRIRRQNQWIVAGYNWLENSKNKEKIKQALGKTHDAIFFPLEMNLVRHQWLLNQSETVFASGLKLDSLTLSQTIQESFLDKTPVILSESQQELHGCKGNRNLAMPDPASQLNRIYSRLR